MQIRDQFCISSCRGTAGRGSLVAHNGAAKQHYEEWYGGAADLAGGCVAVDRLARAERSFCSLLAHDGLS